MKGFNGIRNHGLCLCVAMLYQLSYEVPHIGSRPIDRAHLNPGQDETLNESDSELRGNTDELNR